LLGIAALLVGLPVQSETVYLVINTTMATLSTTNLDVHSLPMESYEQCEESGIKLLASKRYKIDKDFRKWTHVGFECIEGK